MCDVTGTVAVSIFPTTPCCSVFPWAERRVDDGASRTEHGGGGRSTLQTFVAWFHHRDVAVLLDASFAS